MINEDVICADPDDHKRGHNDDSDDYITKAQGVSKT